MAGILTLTDYAVTVSDSQLGPFNNPGGMGFRVLIDRSGLPAGRPGDGLILTAAPYFSFDNRKTWVKQFVLHLKSGVMLDKRGDVIPFTTVSSPWQKTPEGVVLSPDSIRVDITGFVSGTIASISVETM